MITQNTNGTYETTVRPFESYWKTDEGQKYLSDIFPIEKAWMIDAISSDEYYFHLAELKGEVFDESLLDFDPSNQRQVDFRNDWDTAFEKHHGGSK